MNLRHLFQTRGYEKALLLLFILTLPLCNPWVRGDGVGYYAFAKSLLIDHRLDFTKDWLEANETYRLGRINAAGAILLNQYTSTGHLDNHFSIGPAILWAPFLVTAHLAVLSWNRLGGHVSPDGYSAPYRLAMAFGTAVYGFLALLISFFLARRYVSERWAFLATLGIWFASSLPVYMYFNPSWSHAHSAFAVALFVWIWITTRIDRTSLQWLVLGVIGGLMMDVYYPNGILLGLPLLESLSAYGTMRKQTSSAWEKLFLNNLIFAGALFIALLPTVIEKKVIYGAYTKSGYENLWTWTSPALIKVLFSADHGLFSWTPILILAVLGLCFLRPCDRKLGLYFLLVFAVWLYVIGCYVSWDGISSFGNRFFVSLTPLFVIGLAAFFGQLAQMWSEGRTVLVVYSAVVLLSLWNLGLVFQWGMHLIPDRGPISWRATAYNQVAIVPKEAILALEMYLAHRKSLMDRIEQQDLRGLTK